MATKAALPPPVGDLGVLLGGRLLLLPASVRQPAEAGGEAQTAVRRRPVPERSQVRSPTHLHPSCTPALEQDTDCSLCRSGRTKTLLLLLEYTQTTTHHILTFPAAAVKFGSRKCFNINRTLQSVVSESNSEHFCPDISQLTASLKHINALRFSRSRTLLTCCLHYDQYETNTA